MSSVDRLLAKARVAQCAMLPFSQEQVDQFAYTIAKVVYDNAEFFAKETVAESNIGNVPDKIAKKQAKAELIWQDVSTIKTVGVVEEDPEKHEITIAEPVGVVTGIAPCTNPVVTAMAYAIFAIKTRNAIIISPHPKTINITVKAVEMMMARAQALGLPAHAIQVVTPADLAGTDAMTLTQELMAKADLVVATGGAKLVESAYKSGTPAFGVGPGNVPALVHDTADLADAVQKIIRGRSFDNGVICASEQHLIATKQIMPALLAEFKKQGAYVIESPEEKTKIGALMANPKDRMECTGKSVQYAAEKAGFTVPETAKVMLVEADKSQIGIDPMSSEKMFPILSVYTTESFSESVQLSKSILDFMGRGHTAAIHADYEKAKDDVLTFATAMPVTHVLINQISATSSGGSRFNHLTPSTTLGCGTYGRTAAMDTINLTCKQMLNYKKASRVLPESRIQTAIF